MHADITPTTLEHIKAGNIHMALSPNQGVQGFVGFIATFLAAHSDLIDPFNDYKVSGYNPMRVPITVAECQETGALGAATGAGVATGIFTDYEAGISAMTRCGRVFEPVAAMREHYDHRYRTYLSLIEAMRPFWAAQQLASPDPDIA